MAKPQRLPPQQQRQPQQQVVTHHQQVVRSGPIPAPDELVEYDRLLPGSADRIIAMAEREQAHRQNLDDMAQRADIKHRDDATAAQREIARGSFRSDLIGQILGALVAAGCIAGAVYTTYIGAHPLIPIALVGLPIASIIKAIRSSQPK